MPLQGSHNFMKTKFPEFSLIFPWEIIKIPWKLISLQREFSAVRATRSGFWEAHLQNDKQEKPLLQLPQLNSLSFPWFFRIFSISLSFPCLEKWTIIFQVFPDFQRMWEPCIMLPTYVTLFQTLSYTVTCAYFGLHPILDIHLVHQLFSWALPKTF